MTDNNGTANEDAVIHFTPDQAAVVMREIRKTFSGLKMIYEAAEKPSEDGLNVELATNILKLAEYQLSDIGKALAIQTESAAERDERNARLRELNTRVRDLEAQLGASQSPEVTQASLKVMADHLNKWWKLEGFGFIKEIAFGQHVCTVELSCMLSESRWFETDTPVSDKEAKKLWHESLRARGFELVADGRDFCVADTEASRKTLCDLITSRLPSAKVRKLENMSRNRVPGFILWTAEVYIHNIAEILQLPTKDQPEGQAA